jgi:hypothetical protein
LSWAARRVLAVRRHAAGQQRLDDLGLPPLDRDPERRAFHGVGYRGIDAGLEEERHVRDVTLGDFLHRHLS